MEYWTKIINSKDIICYEKNKADVSVRLEARAEDEDWTVYRGFYAGEELNYTEEYRTQTREEAERLLLQLKKERDITINELSSLVKEKNKKVSVHLKRGFKEETVEKWFFRINDDSTLN